MRAMGEWWRILGTVTRVLRGPRHSEVWVCCAVVLLLCSLLPTGCEGQGRLVDPPSRASMWRYDFSNPVDFNDDRVDCGGFVRQWRKNQGRCGVCGDPWDLTAPRPHETRGRYGRGIIVRNYTQAQAVVVEVEVTAAGSGHFEYTLCPRGSPWTQETQECFTHPLKDDFGRSQIPVNVTKKFARLRHVLRLPQEVVCLACILQWKYVTGGRAGREEYRACADITISSVTTELPLPANTTTAATTVTTSTTAATDTDNGTTITTDMDTVTTVTTTAKEIATILPTTLASLPAGKFEFPPSHVPEVNLDKPGTTHKPALKSEDPQTHAPPAQTRMNDLMQNDSGETDGDNGGGASTRSVTLYYGVTITLVIFRCCNLI